jgi:hypothetical protein
MAQVYIKIKLLTKNVIDVNVKTLCRKIQRKQNGCTNIIGVKDLGQTIQRKQNGYTNVMGAKALEQKIQRRCGLQGQW